jgi:ectoine hydroxylase-related dioxygenase (phytanoyl-CoA dioxygenase family)
MIVSMEEHIDRIRTEGWTVIEGIIPEERIEAHKTEFYRVARENDIGSSLAGLIFIPSVINFYQEMAEHLADPKIMGVVEALLGENSKVSFTSAIINEPGNERGGWHADWPFNARNAGCIKAPYPDGVFHLTALWMLSPFSAENGGTLVVPRSHLKSTNPTYWSIEEASKPLPNEFNASGPAGAVLLIDSRLWHATSKNHSDQPRVSFVNRYAPWWLNLNILKPGSLERRMMVDEPGKSDNHVPPVKREVYDKIPEVAQPLFRHWLEE